MGQKFLSPFKFCHVKEKEHHVLKLITVVATSMLAAIWGTTDVPSLGPTALFWSIRNPSSFKLQRLLHVAKITEISDFFVMSWNNSKALCKNLIIKNGVGLVGGDLSWSSVEFWLLSTSEMHSVTRTSTEVLPLKRRLDLDMNDLLPNF